MKSIALAIFVKTVGYSSIKTRLGSSIGKEQAERFYSYSLLAISEVMNRLSKDNPSLTIYWAVAEKDALKSSVWSEFAVVSQGEGESLGERLSHVYSELIAKHEGVCFIGGDSPHITVSEYENGILQLKNGSKDTFIMGKTLDGGFYFFGGKKAIPQKIWTSVEYSQNTTAENLQRNLLNIGTIDTIKTSYDIDEVVDLQRYADIDLMNEELLPVQKELIKWGKTLK